MKKLLSILLLSIGVFACQDGTKGDKTEGSILYVDLDSTPDAEKLEKALSSMQLRLLPLESKDSIYFKTDNSFVSIYGGYIFVYDASQHHITRFDKDGKFINQINRRGQGEEEYPFIRKASIANNKIYILIEELVKVYDFEGNYLKSIPFEKGKGGGQLYATEDGRLFIGRSFMHDTQWLVYNEDGKLSGEYIAPEFDARKYFRPFNCEHGVGEYNGGVYMATYFNHKIHFLKDTTVSVLARIDFKNKNLPADFFEGEEEALAKKFRDNWDKAVYAIEDLLVTDKWIICTLGSKKNGSLYYNRENGFYMNSKDFPLPYSALFGGWNVPTGYDTQSGEFYRLASPMRLKDAVEELAETDSDYLQKYPFLQSIDFDKVDDDTNDFVVFVKM